MQTLLVLQELRHLLAEIGSVGEHHLKHVEADLIQTDVLLDEAIAVLTQSFSKLFQVIQEQQEEIDLLLRGKKAATPENLQHLSTLKDVVNAQINVMVTGMQFQDMTSQLLERIVRRVNGLREVLNMVSESSQHLPVEGDITADQISVLLSQMLDNMSQKTTELENILWRSVRQTRMESGDVDLF